VVLLVVVVWVWANVEVTVKPKMVIMAPIENNVFISDRGQASIQEPGFGLDLDCSQKKIAPRRYRGCETIGELTEMTSL